MRTTADGSDEPRDEVAAWATSRSSIARTTEPAPAAGTSMNFRARPAIRLYTATGSPWSPRLRAEFSPITARPAMPFFSDMARSIFLRSRPAGCGKRVCRETSRRSEALRSNPALGPERPRRYPVSDSLHGVDASTGADPRHRQPAMSGMSVPCSRMYAAWAASFSSIALAT